MNSFIILADAKRIQYCLEKFPQPGQAHTVNRAKIFDHVKKLFCSEQFLKEFPIYIEFEDEMAIDTGGVHRDMLSAFWEEAYKHFFDGSCLLVPSVHPNMDVSLMPTLGLVLSHGYLVSGFMPTRIAFPALASVLLDSPISFPTSMLIEAFAESLSVFEAGEIKKALATDSSSFSKAQNTIMSILSRFGCRVCPTPQNIESVTASTAKFVFQIQPMAAYSMITSGIPLEERKFWQSYSLEELHSLYMAANATPAKVLEVLEEPIFNNEAESKVFDYLQQFIGNMKNNDLRRFLRFTTGSSALMSGPIVVSFNSSDGIARLPRTHTCGSSLELSTNYFSYQDFEDLFSSVLNDELTWEMRVK